MAGRGFAPKAEHSRERDTKRRTAPQSVVTPDDALRGPELTNTLPWHPQTVAWWETWRRSPQAQTFLDTDWDFLAETALLHSALWDGNLSVAGELRLRTAKFGATLEDRARLRMQVDADVAAVKSIDQDALEAANKRKTQILGLINGDVA